MHKRLLSILFTIGISTFIWSQEQDNIVFSGGVEAFGYLSNEELPFWTFTNTYGRLGPETNGLVYAFAKADYALSPNSSIVIKASGVGRDGIDPSVQRAELYARFKNSWIDITVGSKDFTDNTYELSSVRRNILFSSNTRALPGIIIQNASPITLFKNVSVDGAIAHFMLNDDRFVDNVNVHYKNIYFNWDISTSSSLRFGLQHVAQWGGNSPLRGEQPDGLSDLVKIFFGSGGGENASFGDQVNALGNHIGSYSIEYKKRNTDGIDFDVYYQSLFEDRSGIELNNFPDGVWGISVSPKSSKLFKTFLYEYVQTVSQSGSPRAVQNGGQQSGGDNYFINGTYRSGWTYEGRTIGLPFITIAPSVEGLSNATNNRSIAHHLGVAGGFWKLNYQLKLTYLENLGTFAVPRSPRDTFVYSYFKTLLPVENIGVFSAEIGADFNENRDTFFGVGIGYRYTF
ncbi:capsule assembly Wzi family protein [uncultured Dokdonia sp.]|uniref:capsule assembly Wzi family protein n=1 Tax=uncultured Dokdonia sp. TaxID=575653 RepID=UPI002609B7EB|nr:capsule assembly Wzi family protein [uncultured Dokdonia sp.]